MRRLADVDKVFALVDGKREADISLSWLFETHLEALRHGQRLDTSYFSVRFYPGIGTIHFYPKDQRLLDRINVIVGKHRNWMPESHVPSEEPAYQAAKETAEQVRSQLSPYTLRQACNGWRCEEVEQELAKAFELAVAEGGEANFWIDQLGADKTHPTVTTRPVLVQAS